MLFLLLTSCKSTSSPSVYVPELNVEVEKPPLEAIPYLDISEYTIEQQTAVLNVFNVYNSNLVKLIDYSNRLLEMQKVIIDYYKEIIKASN